MHSLEKTVGVTTFLLHQFATKNLVRSSQKCEKEEKAEKLKLKKVKWNEMKTLFVCLANSWQLMVDIDYLH